MAKSPLDHDRPEEGKAAREYARVERETADPMSDPKVKSMNKASRGDEDKAGKAREFARIEREKAEAVSDPKVKSMAKGAHKDEDKSVASRLKKFLKIDRQGSES